MNINPDYSNESFTTAVEAMDHSMSWLFENFIEPKEADLTIEDTMLLGIMGATLKEIARRADAYDQLQDGSNEFSRN